MPQWPSFRRHASMRMGIPRAPANQLTMSERATNSTHTHLFCADCLNVGVRRTAGIVRFVLCGGAFLRFPLLPRLAVLGLSHDFHIRRGIEFPAGSVACRAAAILIGGSHLAPNSHAIIPFDCARDIRGEWHFELFDIITRDESDFEYKHTHRGTPPQLTHTRTHTLKHTYKDCASLHTHRGRPPQTVQIRNQRFDSNVLPQLCNACDLETRTQVSRFPEHLSSREAEVAALRNGIAQTVSVERLREPKRERCIHTLTSMPPAAEVNEIREYSPSASSHTRTPCTLSQAAARPTHARRATHPHPIRARDQTKVTLYRGIAPTESRDPIFSAAF